MTFADNPVIAHRGAWKTLGLPENSIAALKQAISIGCCGSEFDVRMTADDYVVVHHDKHFHELPIENSNYADLKKFKLVNGETLPTLTEYILAGIENNKQTQLICEIKPSAIGKTRAEQIVRKVLAVVDDLKAHQYMAYISFDFNMLEIIGQLDPNANTQYLNGDKSPKEIKSANLTGIDYHSTVFKENPEWIENAKKLDLILNTWTVNSKKAMDLFLKEGFDFITTNEPEILLKKYNASL